MTYEIGKRYKVPCVLTTDEKWNDLWRGEFVPIMGPLHDDVQFIQFPHLHWHIDWRFVSNRLWKRLTARAFGRPVSHQAAATVLCKHACNTEKPNTGEKFVVSDVVTRIKMCQREFPTPYPREIAKWLPALEAHLSGARMENMTCPHRGLSLAGILIVNGVVTCPGHGLRWNVATGELVKELDGAGQQEPQSTATKQSPQSELCESAGAT